jgi:hypothetical protein
MEQYEFSEFLDSVKHIDDIITLNQKALTRQRELEKFSSSKKGKQYLRDRAGHLAAQIGKFRFWLATGGRAGEMSDNEFALMEPICRSLVDKGIFQTRGARHLSSRDDSSLVMRSVGRHSG